MPHLEPNQNPVIQQARKQEAAISDPSSPVPVAPAPSPTPSDQLATIQESLEANTARITSSIQQLERGVQVTKTATDVVTSAISDITAAKQITALATGNADLQAQNATIDAFEAAGGVDIQAELMATLASDADRVRGLIDEAADIRDDEHTGIQLIDGVINELRSFQTEAEIRTAQAQQRQTVNEISNVSAATESFARVNALTKKTLNQGVIQANYDQIAAEGRIKGAEAEIANVQTNANAMASLVAADARGVANRVNAFRLEGEAEARELSRERMVLQREQMAVDREKLAIELPASRIRLKLLNEQLADTTDPKRRAALSAQRDSAVKQFEDQVALEDQLTESVQRGQALAGVAIEDRETIVFGITNPTTRDKYTALQERGGSANQTVGDTAFDAKATMELIAPLGGSIESPALDALDAITNKQLKAYSETVDGVPKDTAVIERDFNITAAEFMIGKSEQISTGDSSNPYHAPPMGTLTENFQAIKDSTFYKRVIAPMNMKEINPEKIIDAGVSGIRAGTVSPEEVASGIETIFESAAAYNNTLNGGYRRFGLPNQTTYNVLLKAPKGFVEKLKLGGLILIPPTLLTPDLASDAARAFRTDTATVDLMDRTRVQESLIRFLSAGSPTAETADTTDIGTEQ